MTVTAAPSVLPAGTREYVPLGPYTTLGIGGPARYFVEAASETAVREALAFADARGLPVLLLGEGSNLLVADEGFPGLVLRMAIRDSCKRLARAAGG